MASVSADFGGFEAIRVCDAAIMRVIRRLGSACKRRGDAARRLQAPHYSFASWCSNLALLVLGLANQAITYLLPFSQFVELL